MGHALLPTIVRDSKKYTSVEDALDKTRLGKRDTVILNLREREESFQIVSYLSLL
jgi:hypothetical protein